MYTGKKSSVIKFKLILKQSSIFLLTTMQFIKVTINFTVIVTVVLAFNGNVIKGHVARLEESSEDKTYHSHPLYKLLPEGCYGRKQLREIASGYTTIKYKPIKPEYCTEDGFLVPMHLKTKAFQIWKPPYRINVEPKASKTAYQVILKSESWNSGIMEAIIVARPVLSHGMVGHNNLGRFIQTPGVDLICCSYTDIDVARFQSKQFSVQEVEFNWLPYEEVEEDYEGSLIFIATVVKTLNEYWINVTSETINVVSTGTLMFSDSFG